VNDSTLAHSLRRFLRRCVRRLSRWLAFALIALAVGVAILRLALPWYVGDHRQVAAWLSQALGTQVQLARSSLELERGAFPRIHLEGLSIGQGDTAIRLDSAELEIDLAALLVRTRPLLHRLQINRLELLADYRDGRFSIAGLPLQAGRGRLVEQIGVWTASDVSLRLRAEEFQTELHLEHGNVELAKRGKQLRFGFRTPSGLRLRADAEIAEQLIWRAYVEASELALGPGQRVQGLLPQSGSIDLRAWLTPESDRMAVLGELSWRNVSLLKETTATRPSAESEASDQASVERSEPPSERGIVVADSKLQWRGQVDGRGFHLSMRAGEAAGSVFLPTRASGLEPALSVENLPLQGISELVLNSSALSKTAVFSELELEGLIQRGHWHGGRDGAGSMELKRVSVRSERPVIPSIGAVDAVLKFDLHGGVFALSGKQVEWQQPLIFARSVPLSFEAEGSFSVLPAGLDLEIDQVQLKSLSASASADARILMRKGMKPYIDMRARVDRGHVRDAYRFLPVNRVRPKVIEWFERALVKGEVRDSLLLWRGQLGKPFWPYSEAQGRFEADINAIAATLDYHPEWPKAEGVDAKVRFINSSLLIEHASGTAADARMTVDRAQIPVLKDPVLEMSMSGQADAGVWLGFLEATPVGVKFDSVLKGMQASGPVSTHAVLRLPLKKELGEAELHGVADLESMDFRADKWSVDFRELKGRSAFSRFGFDAKGLQLKAPSGNAGTLNIAVGDATSLPLTSVAATLDGSFSASDVFGIHSALAGILKKTEGVAPWRFELKAFKPEADGETEVELSTRSSLKGIAVDLPKPLDKRKGISAPLDLLVRFPAAGPITLDLAIARRVSMLSHFETPSSPYRAHLLLGGDERNLRLPVQGMDITGSVDLADPFAWLPALSAPSEGPSDLNRIDLRVRSDQPGHLRINREGLGFLLSINSPVAKGEVKLQSVLDEAALDVEFERLYLPKPKTGGDALPSIDPRWLPSIHGRIKDARLGDAALGELRLESVPVRDGARIDLLESSSDAMKIRGSGSWLLTEGKQKSEFELQFSADDLGKFMRSLGFAEQISSSQSLATIRAHWEGPPTQFGLERLNGKLELWVGAGRFVEVDPGAGRLFGLLSMTALPRRLALDFRDFFQSGMAFDEIKGSFELSEGNAWTEDLKIRAPAAEVLVIGRTGIAARDYDQQVLVAPRIGSVLPFVGALAAGPGGAAAGVIAQGMLAQGPVYRQEYRVGGSWDKPDIKRQRSTGPAREGS
jgi:uncharacterized protein (TIGR02099 family)